MFCGKPKLDADCGKFLNMLSKVGVPNGVVVVPDVRRDLDVLEFVFVVPERDVVFDVPEVRDRLLEVFRVVFLRDVPVVEFLAIIVHPFVSCASSGVCHATWHFMQRLEGSLLRPLPPRKHFCAMHKKPVAPSPHDATHTTYGSDNMFPLFLIFVPPFCAKHCDGTKKRR